MGKQDLMDWREGGREGGGSLAAAALYTTLSNCFCVIQIVLRCLGVPFRVPLGRGRLFCVNIVAHWLWNHRSGTCGGSVHYGV